MGANDQRWMNMNAPRSNRTITRKPLGSNVAHVQSGSIGLSQATALASASPGLLSLGTRYTPSSAAAFGASAGMGGGSLVGSGGTAGGLVSSNVSGLGVDRDQNYRLAAAIAGTGGRGRPRGRRPLRGQFPVVPIDMVRQLGIEQQVILQPAAPVAMRNKAVLCRPLSMCRKTQSSVVQYEGAPQDNNSMSVQTEDVEELSIRRAQRKKDSKPQKPPDSLHVDDDALSDTEVKSVKRRATLDAQTSTPLTAKLIDSNSQTEAPEEPTSKAVQFIPVPVPVPIFVPIPVCLFARPVPYLLPFPLPCPILLPLPAVGDTTESETGVLETLGVDDVAAELDAEYARQTDSASEAEVSPRTEPEVFTQPPEEESDSLVIAAESTAPESAEQIHTPIHGGDRGLKRRAESPPPEPEAESVADSERQLQIVPAQSLADRVQLTESITIQPPHSTPAAAMTAPPPKRPRHTMVVSDANYHLKFSYGINAWRHWVQQKLTSLSGVNSTATQQQYPHLRTELLNMSDTDLNTALSQFVREVRKPNNECYVADSIFYLCLGIQEYLNENGCTVNLFGGPVFSDFSKALDEILANFQPRISPEGLLICRIEEEHLWEARQLGAQSAEVVILRVLLFTMLYFNTKHFGLRLGTIHRQLAFSQFQMINEHNAGTAILCHLPGTVFGSDEEASSTLRLDMNEDYSERCPVRLFKTYFSRCPPAVRSSEDMFYMTPVYFPDQSDYWYSNTPMDPDDLQVILNRIKMVKEIQEAFMNGQPDGGF
ncbi:Zinc finger MYM-type protein 3 [Paragonimus heterotremus]|uniref:Zinc finger MYM-type protein 3 n=1 Tax=Paragonimus heterotremus TaxID=100268 RepID=A0A8J4SNB9_9TREM|nr:Zinc finger MYM-type protein 3 [Paragonimus heterotremus]